MYAFPQTPNTRIKYIEKKNRKNGGMTKREPPVKETSFMIIKKSHFTLVFVFITFVLPTN